MNGLHGIIFSFERRDDLGALTESRAPSSIPFGGRYRAVDFSLSNLVNAGAADVGVIFSGQYESLLDHLGTGKNWDLSRKRGGLKILPLLAYGGKTQRTDFRGRLEALAAVRPYLSEIRQDYVCLMDGDLVANLPLGEILETHLRSGADMTAVCGGDGAFVEDGTYFQLAADGKILDVFYHLKQPMEFRSLEVYVLSRKLLIELVDQFAKQNLYSWRHAIRLCRDDLDLRGYVWNGFAAQIRSVREYYERSMQLLEPDVRADLFCAERPIRAKGADKSSAYIGPRGRCSGSLVADGCNIEGTVENSILFPGVVIEPGAVVRDSILFKEVKIRRSAQLCRVIADKRVEVLNSRKIAGRAGEPLVLKKESVV